MRRFENFNPATLLIYYMTVIIPIMVFMNPFIILTALAAGLVRAGIYERKIPVKRILFSAVLTAVMALVNGLLSHQGDTELFFINDRAVTLEAIRYGAVNGLMLAAAIVWFSAFSRTLTGEKIMALLWHLPKLALLISMIMRLIPRYLERYNKTRLAARINEERGQVPEKKHIMQITSAVFTWALENSMDTADSMIMRGYTSGGKRISGIQFRPGDAAVLALTAALQTMYFLPETWHGILMAVLCFLPEIYRIKENVKWKIYTLKI